MKPSEQNMGRNVGRNIGRRIGGALVFGFSVIFAFAFVAQVTADIVNWISGSHIQFMFRRGLSYALADMRELTRVIISLSFFSLILAGVFFAVKLRSRHGIFDIYDDTDADDGSE